MDEKPTEPTKIAVTSEPTEQAVSSELPMNEPAPQDVASEMPAEQPAEAVESATPAEPVSTEGSAVPTPEAPAAEAPATATLDAGQAEPPVASTDVPPTPEAPKQSSGTLLKVVGLVIIAAVVGGSIFAAYSYGKKQVKPVAAAAPMTTSSTAAKTISVPQGATVVEQCVPGLGAQYVLPKDIPDGPIYNVSQGKVVAIEYMADLSKLSSSKNMTDAFDLQGLQYDHVNIASMPGHAGLSDAHYQIDFMMIPQSQAAKITCGTSSSSAPASTSTSMSSSMSSGSTSKTSTSSTTTNSSTPSTGAPSTVSPKM